MHDHGHAPPGGSGAPRVPPPLARGAGQGKILYVDAPSGLAGDMTIAALLDLGVPVEVLERALGALPFGGYRVVHGRATRSAIVGRRFDVEVTSPQAPRDYASIRAMLDEAPLETATRALAQAVFRRIAEAEAEVHAVPVDAVHFHEVGAVDSIVDVVGASALLAYLAPGEVVVSPLPLGRGATGSEHGPIPLPAPATVPILRGLPTYDAGIDFELVTPTGAALVAATAARAGGWPAMRPERVGWGAGTRDLQDRANVLRLVLGAPNERDPGGPGDGADTTHVVVEANLDDATPEVVGHAMARLLEAGALDAWTTPAGMKKSRPGVVLSAIAPRARAEAVARVLLAETPTLGARLVPVRRVERPRRFVEVATPYGPIPVKVADGDGLPEVASPEYEACRAAAEAHGVPLRVVMEAARAALATR